MKLRELLLLLMTGVTSVALLAVGAAVCACQTAREADHDPADPKQGRVSVRVLSAVGMRQVLLDLGPKFERANRNSLIIDIDSGGEIVKRIDSGEVADVVVLPREGIDRLIGSGRIISGTVVDLAASHVGVAVRKGAPKPDIATPGAFKQAMLAARSIACPDPARGGASGMHITRIFKELGIAELVQDKLVYASIPSRADAMPGNSVAEGKAEIALHQMQELMAVTGVEIVGPLPTPLQATFTFAAGIHKAAIDRKAAEAFIDYLRTPAAREVIAAKGMHPVAP